MKTKPFQHFPSLRNVKYFFRINHLSLLRGILLHFGIAEEDHRNIFNLIHEGEKWFDFKCLMFYIYLVFPTVGNTAN